MNNIINIDKLFRKYGGSQARIQPGAVDQLHSYLQVWFETSVPDLQAVAASHKRQTVYTEDIIEYFSFPINEPTNLKEKVE